jgi:Nucleotidyl transferase AbiEii toxin, Type IV TA system
MRDDKAKKVLDTKQLALLPLLQEFSSTHILVWGTAISLQLWHRKSIDFDLFSFGPQGSGKELMQRIQKSWCQIDLASAPPFWLDEKEYPELTLFFDGVKFQWIDFSRNPFDVTVLLESSKNICSIPSLNLLDLGALKCYAMMYRSKWKDAVDIYMILQQWYSLQQLTHRASEIFQKLYKEIYTYETIIAGEWDMSEEVEWIGEQKVTNEQIITSLKLSLQI